MVKKIVKKKGFTLVELIIVIMIVGISATFIATSYVVAKRKAELNIVADQIIATLKEQRSTVKSGHRIVSEDVTEEGEVLKTYGDPKCFGVRFEKENGVFSIETEYSNGECVKESIELNYPLVDEYDLNIDQLKIATGTSFDSVDILFEPPTGEIVLLSGNLIYEQRDLEIDIYIYDPSNISNHRLITVDTVSGRMGVKIPTE